MLTLDQFDYTLPEELIAQQPLVERDQSKLLTINRHSQRIEHHHFYELPALLQQYSPTQFVLVRNNTKVLPARIFGQKQTGGHVEILLIKRHTISSQGETWECLTKPGLKPGQNIGFDHSALTATCTKIDNYTRLIQFNQAGSTLFNTLYEIGHTPLPPYIEWNTQDEPHLRKIYQTVYAKYEGSVAAPTAGFHFTESLNQQLLDQGVSIEEVTLHVGLGTFLPVKEKKISDHLMHSEWFELKPEVAAKLNLAKASGKKIISVGTTTTRVLETASDEQGHLTAQSGETEIYIYPPYRYKFIDGLITNLHLPKSTLLMLVAAFVSAPNTAHQFTDFTSSSVGKAYLEAIQQHYRFYSFGDSMFLL